MRKVSLLITHYQTGNQNASFHNPLILLSLNVCFELYFLFGKYLFKNSNNPHGIYPSNLVLH
ncbi:hypothetical protein VCSRO110_1480 [Vibrio cholerae]|nr:hypothetical protein FXE90_18890 [Vibrio cholerae]GHX78584.1 hypothetical protein VCSRO110_1480 [Vibrio cholerae]